MQQSAADLLSNTKVEVAPETFALVSVRKASWPRLLADNALSPRGSAPFMVFADQFEVTLLLDSVDFESMRYAVRDEKTETGFRLLTFTSELDFSVVGFLAEVSRILASADIPLVSLSAFSRDHILVKQNHLAAALKALGPFVQELC